MLRAIINTLTYNEHKTVSSFYSHDTHRAKMSDDAEQNILKDIENISLDTMKSVNRRKKINPGFQRNIYNYFSEFASKTGIYGLKYIGEKNRSLVEKFYWLILFCISFYFCTSLILQTWIKWNESSILVSVAQTLTPVWKVPFPAITICSETKTRQRVYNFTDYYHKVLDKMDPEKAHLVDLTDEEIQKFADVSLLCDNHLYKDGNKTTSFNTIKHLIDIAPQFAEVFFSCKLTSQNATCGELFSPILTEDGICFTFNMLDKSELFTNKVFHHGDFLEHGRTSEGWTLENGYPKEASRDTYPRRAMSVGSRAGMFLLLRAYEQDLDYVCRGPVQGFKLLLHNPAELPKIGTQYFRAPLNQEIVVSVKPDMITTSEGLRSYSPHKRQCYFSEERQLQFFQTYTQQNCQAECLTNYTLAKCGCVPYYMPHAEWIEICGSGSNECVFEAEQELLGVEIESEIYRSEITNNEASCDCLPGCTSITYNAEISQADFNWPKVFEAFKANVSEFPGIQMTRLTIFFKDMQFMTSQRNELYSKTDLLAHCGGLLGLFTGISLMSVVEIIYFLSLRIIFNVRKYGKHFWSGSKALLNDDAYFHN